MVNCIPVHELKSGPHQRVNALITISPGQLSIPDKMRLHGAMDLFLSKVRLRQTVKKVTFSAVRGQIQFGVYLCNGSHRHPTT